MGKWVRSVFLVKGNAFFRKGKPSSEEENPSSEGRSGVGEGKIASEGAGETKEVVSTWQAGNGKNRLGRAECALAVCQSGNHFLYLLD